MSPDLQRQPSAVVLWVAEMTWLPNSEKQIKMFSLHNTKINIVICIIIENVHSQLKCPPPIFIYLVILFHEKNETTLLLHLPVENERGAWWVNHQKHRVSPLPERTSGSERH